MSTPTEPATDAAVGRAPGRVCLLGEHCDWAGGACLVAPLERALEVRAYRGAWGLLVRSSMGLSRFGPALLGVPGDPNRYVAAVARALMQQGVPLPPMRVNVTGDLPPGRGFSSSAAVCVAATRAMLALTGLSWSPDDVAALALTAERDLLGVPCGLMDPLACAHARVLAIDWGPPVDLRPLDPPVAPPLLVAYFPTGRAAGPILDALNAAVKDGDPDVRGAIDTWARCAVRGAAALEAGDLPALGAEMNRAQAAYEALSIDVLEAPGLVAACRALREAGALGAKFTGAGGDGSLVALFADAEGVARGRALLVSLGLTAL
ncbi:MAG: hypothetical protein H6739_05425 [Alphaproteobacteria bacterium]|nr:hypothetical protein [Alphaproteobacteria bacterium]